MTEFLSVNDAAGELRVQPRTVRDYIHSGRLRATRIGKQYRIRVEDLEVFAGGGAVPSGAPAAAPVPVPVLDAPSSTPASQATVILDIDTSDEAVAQRVLTLVGARGFATGVDLHVSTSAGSSALKIILTGRVGGVLDAAAGVRRALEATHG